MPNQASPNAILRGEAAPGPRPGRILGRGRSGLVYAEQVGAHERAVKVFLGDPAGDAVNTLLTGAPAPYAWCEAAVRCAYHRRRILTALVEHWLGGRLRVADAHAVRWNETARAWELSAELVDGRPAALHHPFSASTDDEQRELVTSIQRPLQRHLRAAGFVGMLWQAGLGNPVAADNFLRDRSGRARWVWIDLESGVPALFPLDPRALVSTYVPWSLRLRRPLFDDTDVDRLRAYVSAREATLREALGGEALDRLMVEIDGLAAAQEEWRSFGRVESGVLAALSSGRIDDVQAAAYLARPTSWVRDEIVRHSRRLLEAARRLPARAWRRLQSLRPARAIRFTCRFVASQRFRERIARHLVACRIRDWRRRGHLGNREAGYLRRLARHRDQTAYLTDFAAHVALKPLYKAVSWVVIPAAVQVGGAPFWLVPFALVFGGSLVRTVYTGARGLQAVCMREPFPWVALAVGALPVLGSAAYPAQIVHTSRTREGTLAALMLYDIVTSSGRSIPIWGGADSRTEHFFNRLPDLVVRRREPLLTPASGVAEHGP